LQEEFMRRFRTGALAIFLAAVALLGADAKDCLDMSAKVDNDISSPSGVRVTVVGRNRCSEDLDGSQARFSVKAIGTGGSVIASQHGRFGGTVAAHGQVETKVFVVCDPDRVRSVRAEAN
jgi:hypothetical protein